MKTRFACIEVRAPGTEAAERAAAVAMAAGAAGLEEREDPSGIVLLIYTSEDALAAVVAALSAGAGGDFTVGAPEPVEEVDWSQEWRRGLAPVVVSPRLAVVPDDVAFVPLPGQAVLAIDPAQAFGTGAHASTFLALEGLDALAPEDLCDAHVVDLGSGTGVLALAALHLGARVVDAFDCDPIAARATRDNAVVNGLASGVRVFCGRSEALAGPLRDGVVANLLRRELLPCLADIATWLRPGGWLVLAGLLAVEQEEVTRALLRAGFSAPQARTRRDAGGDAGDEWLGLVTRRTAERASPRAGR